MLTYLINRGRKRLAGTTTVDARSLMLTISIAKLTALVSNGYRRRERSHRQGSRDRIGCEIRPKGGGVRPPSTRTAKARVREITQAGFWPSNYTRGVCV
jgi:hypothetical protein